MKKLWDILTHLGVHDGLDKNLKRYVIITNRVSILVSGFIFVAAIVGVLYFGLIISIKLAFLSSLVFILPLLINRLNLIHLSRIYLSVIVSLASVAVSVLDKFDYIRLEEFQYFEFRLTLLCTSLFPFILFKLKEKSYWLLSLGANLLCLILYDPIHNFFNVGYYQLGLSGPNYPFLNFMFLACFAILAGCTYFLKSSFEKYENENLLLIDEISQRGRELLSANNIIETQRAELAEENIHLNKELIEKNNQLTETNHELIRHNNDLQQYSYTVSHNLRGPVASISGLLNLLDKNQLGESNKELIRYFQKATASLDTTIKDLSNIIDTRNEISRVNQKIEFKEIFYQVTALLQKEVKENDVQLITQFELASEVYSVKSMINSIFYNLISNAIKYRSPDRQPNITITTHREEPFVKIVVEDNGLGIDLEKYGHKIFGLYKRFHTHTEGKGLGLFLVKLQVESLGGEIEVRSKLGKGTQFSIHLKVPKNIEEQVLLEDESAKLFYQASLNALHVIWKKNTSTEEFEKVIQLSLEFLKVYLTPNWISDLRLSYNRDEDELNKVRAKYTDQLKRAGLARIAIIKPIDQENFNKNSFLEKVQDNYSAPIVFFDSRESAEEWLRQENKKQSQINLEFNHQDSRSS